MTPSDLTALAEKLALLSCEHEIYCPEGGAVERLLLQAAAALREVVRQQQTDDDQTRSAETVTEPSSVSTRPATRLYRGHIDPDCEVVRGVGWMCTCETPEEKAERARERAEIEAERDAESRRGDEPRDVPEAGQPGDAGNTDTINDERIEEIRRLHASHINGHIVHPQIGFLLNQIELLEARLLAMTAERDALRETTTRLNRRATNAEAALRVKVEDFNKRASGSVVRSCVFRLNEQLQAEAVRLREERNRLTVLLGRQHLYTEKAEADADRLRGALRTLHMECLDDGHTDSGKGEGACQRRGMAIRCGICSALDEVRDALASSEAGMKEETKDR